MSASAYLAIDIGTSSVKGALIDPSGCLLASTRAPVGLYRGADERQYESDSAEWYSAASLVARGLTAATGRLEVLAIALSGNGPTLVPCDEAGNGVGRALSWMDRRARDEAARISALAGLPLDPSFYLPKVLWLRDRAPERFARVAHFFACPEWLSYKLSGVASSWLGDPYYERYTWALDTAKALGLDTSLFPPYQPPARVMGRLLPGPAADLGLEPDIPVVSGFPDFLASLVGSGATEPGIACDRSGTSEAFNLCSERPFPDFSLLSLPHAIAGLWNVSGGLSTSGKALEWFAEASGLVEEGAAGVMAEARRAEPGAGGLLFLPYLAGERAPLWDRDLRGAFLGLAQGHGRRELARAVAESLAYGLRLSSDKLAASGYPSRLVRLSGSAARDDFMNRLKADILGLPFERPAIVDGELLGDACACAVALGEASSLQEAAARMVRIEARFEPETRHRARYDALFGAHREALGSLAGISGRLAGLAASFEAESPKGSGE